MVNLLPGTEVQARGLRWEVILSQPLGGQTLYRLRGLSGAFRNREIELLEPFETIKPTLRELAPERAGPIRNWLVYHQAFLLEQALGPDAFLAVQPGRLRIEPYQLVPVLRAIRMSRARLLLADAVGLGKTIQAGIVVVELMARKLAHRVLFVSPAGPLLDQWRTEMRERFGLRLDVLDRARMEEIRREHELGANPFDHAPLALASIDFLKQERVLELLERSSFDVVVIDEAHHVMDLGAGQDREDSQRRRLAEVLARISDSLILATATPHDGNDRSFASLCELLDPSLIDGRGNLRGDAYRAHVVRRLKSHIIDPKTGLERFKRRRVFPCPVTVVASRHGNFIALQRRLVELVAPLLKRAFRDRRFNEVLAFISLLKRSVSTVEACRRTLAVVQERFEHALREDAESQEMRRERMRTLRDYHRKLARYGTLSAEESETQEVLEAEDLAQQLADLERQVRAGSRGLAKVASVVEALNELLDLAAAALDEDPKIQRVLELVEEIRAGEPQANILIYSEYVDSLEALTARLRKRWGASVLTMTGELDDRGRGRVTDRFRTESGLILVSTDASAEGLNLHQRCHNLIHLELPFNPNRLEQRNGRIDRYGQDFEPLVRYLFLRGTFEERILMRLIVKYERQRARLTFVPNTLGLDTSTERGSERLLKGLMADEGRLFETDDPLPDLAGEEGPGNDEASRELFEEVERSFHVFRETARTHAWLGEAGLNADQRQLEEADRARAGGGNAEAVDLTRFVADAVHFDGGQVTGSPADPVFSVTLPPAWRYGLDDMPGYDAEANTVLLTTDLDITSHQDRPVGFLGRAHPLVRRALERVRSLTYGSAAESHQDHRVGAVQAPVATPELLFTFLGRVESRSGPELERVLGVQIAADGEPRLVDPDEWTALAAPARGIQPTDLWKKSYAAWGDAARDRARAAAVAQFELLSGDFTTRRQSLLESEQRELTAWLRQRAIEITSQAEERSSQTEFFDEGAAPPQPPPVWRTFAEPAERLAGFETDRAQPTKLRNQARVVLELYEHRRKDLAARLALLQPVVVPLGILMLLPEAGHAA
jgi:ERCC4-related helicase